MRKIFHNRSRRHSALGIRLTLTRRVHGTGARPGGPKNSPVRRERAAAQGGFALAKPFPGLGAKSVPGCQAASLRAALQARE
jgi:hypothetical protein